MTNDARNVYLLLELAGLQSGGITLFLDTDQDAASGCGGAEFAVFVTASEPGDHLALSDFGPV